MLTFLGFLKILAAAITAFFSGYGIAHDFKKDGVITREGRIALVGAIAAGLLTLLAQTLETAQANSDAQAQRANSDALMREVIRGVYPLKDISLDIQDRYDDKTSAVASFLGPYVFEMLLAEKNILSRHPRAASGEVRSVKDDLLHANLVVDSDGSPFLLQFGQESKLFPPNGSGPCQALCDHRFSLTLYHRGKQTEAFSFSSEMKPEKLEFMMTKDFTSFIMRGDHLPIENVSTDGTLQGVADLEGIDGTLDVDPGDYETEDERTARLKILAEKLTMETIAIHIGSVYCLISNLPDAINGTLGTSTNAAFYGRPQLRWYFKLSPDPIRSCSGTWLKGPDPAAH